MESDLLGRLRNTRLASAHALLPLFEAIINSVHAIESTDRQGRITVEIERSGELALLDLHGNYLPEILNFTITDNGIGFTGDNYRSFETLDSQAKIKIGGKGVGRLFWLIAFEDVHVESVFEEEGQFFRRAFDFRPTNQGIENVTREELSAGARESGTKIQLRGYRKRFRGAAPKSAAAIARRIVEHCLVLYSIDSMPELVVIDPVVGEEVNLSELYEEEFRRESKTRDFEVQGHKFRMTDILLRATADAENAIHFCAHKRAVITKKLSGLVPHAERAFRMTDGTDVMYWSCVTGELLDNTVDAHRTGFSLSHDDELFALSDEITWEQIFDAAVNASAEFLAPHTEDARKASVERIRDFVEHSEPRYRLLLEHRRDKIEELPTTLTEERLELELHKLLSAWRFEAKAEARAKLDSITTSSESFSEHKDEVIRALGNLQDVSQSDLVDYVIHRSTVLSFFKKVIGLLDTGKFAREDVLHGLFFPQRTTSDMVDYDQHNLWVLDERLAFHHYLASDLRFSSQTNAPAAVESDHRPDIVIYNRKMAFAGEEFRPFSSVVIVEFKRPERDDYNDEKNPVSQLYDYIRDIRSGSARNSDGSSVDRVPDSVPFFCHVVATLTPTLRRQLEDLDFVEGPDGQSYFSFHSKLKAYIEVASYSKVLNDAAKRNQAFFEKLGIPSANRRI